MKVRRRPLESKASGIGNCRRVRIDGWMIGGLKGEVGDIRGNK